LTLQYGADAKANLYACIRTGSDEADGEQQKYELRLYDNGSDWKDDRDCQEIVLQKVYTSSSRDSKLIDFYLVDLSTGEVIDEHRNTW